MLLRAFSKVTWTPLERLAKWFIQQVIKLTLAVNKPLDVKRSLDSLELKTERLGEKALVTDTRQDLTYFMRRSGEEEELPKCQPPRFSAVIAWLNWSAYHSTEPNGLIFRLPFLLSWPPCYTVRDDLIPLMTVWHHVMTSYIVCVSCMAKEREGGWCNPA